MTESIITKNKEELEEERKTAEADAALNRFVVAVERFRWWVENYREGKMFRDGRVLGLR